ncbi:phosphopantetheine-binding protein [Streptomyces sp. NPDC001250]|uniref:phosphopantetheine-binding protein n=1 Tax=Streptomyces sp. NPDC001250 TaxID=3154382 RepID=UPI003333F05A
MNLQQQKDRVTALTEIWREVLGNPDLDENSDLFENDGSSLHVLQITAQIYNVLGMEVRLRHVFSHASPRSLIDFLESESAPGGPAASGTNL